MMKKKPLKKLEKFASKRSNFSVFTGPKKEVLISL